MKPGETYVWPGCYALHRETLKPTIYLMIFYYCVNGALWPAPIEGVNVSAMPLGEGVPTKYVHRMFEAAKTN